MYYEITIDNTQINVQADSLQEAIEDACVFCSSTKTTTNAEFGFTTSQRIKYSYKNGKVLKTIFSTTQFLEPTVMIHRSSIMKNAGKSYPVDFSVKLGRHDLTPLIKKARADSKVCLQTFQQALTKQLLFAFAEGLTRFAH